MMVGGGMVSGCNTGELIRAAKTGISRIPNS
jgi:hypothetical protein